MVGNSVAANLLMIVLLIGGLTFALQIKQEVFPEFSQDKVNVSVSYPEIGRASCRERVLRLV